MSSLPNFRHAHDSDNVHTLCGLTLRFLPPRDEGESPMRLLRDERPPCPQCKTIIGERREVMEVLTPLFPPPVGERKAPSPAPPVRLYQEEKSPRHSLYDLLESLLLQDGYRGGGWEQS